MTWGPDRRMISGVNDVAVMVGLVVCILEPEKILDTCLYHWGRLFGEVLMSIPEYIWVCLWHIAGFDQGFECVGYVRRMRKIVFLC